MPPFPETTTASKYFTPCADLARTLRGFLTLRTRAIWRPALFKRYLTWDRCFCLRGSLREPCASLRAPERKASDQHHLQRPCSIRKNPLLGVILKPSYTNMNIFLLRAKRFRGPPRTPSKPRPGARNRSPRSGNEFSGRSRTILGSTKLRRTNTVRALIQVPLRSGHGP